MKPWKNNLVSGILAVSVACASAGCAGSRVMERPTRETFTTYLQNGDRVEVVLKSGEKRRMVIARMDDDRVWGNPPASDTRYADMASVRAMVRVRQGEPSGGTTHEWREAKRVAADIGAGILIVGLCAGWIVLMAALRAPSIPFPASNSYNADAR